MKKYVVIISGILIVLFVEVIMMFGWYFKRAGISSLEDSKSKSQEADKDEHDVKDDSILEDKSNEDDAKNNKGENDQGKYDKSNNKEVNNAIVTDSTERSEINYITKTGYSMSRASNYNSYYYVCNTSEYLPLRSIPEINDNYLIRKLYNGDIVMLIEKTNDKFWKVKDVETDKIGYVVASYLTV